MDMNVQQVWVENDFLLSYAQGVKLPFSEPISSRNKRTLFKKDIENIIPHRNELLLVDRISVVDLERSFLIGHYHFDPNNIILDAYYKKKSEWPAVFQIEAMNQCGAIGFLLKHNESWKNCNTILTHVCDAQFLRPLYVQGGALEFRVRLFEGSLFYLIIGQCIYQNAIYSVAMMKGLN